MSETGERREVLLAEAQRLMDEARRLMSSLPEEDALPRCQTCRWWRHLDTSAGDRGCCEIPDPKWGIAASGRTAELWTLSDFGCVQWEAKSGE